MFRRDLGESLDFVEGEGEGNILKEDIGTLFWAIGAASLFAGSLGILDDVARVAADVIKTLYARESQRRTESKIYFTFVWGENRKGLPVPIRVRGIRLYLRYVISAVFGVLSVALLLSQL